MLNNPVSLGLIGLIISIVVGVLVDCDEGGG